VPASQTAAATAVLFFVNGMTFSNWLPRIPEVRDRLGLGNAGIGAALLGGGLGGIIGSLIVGTLTERFGSRKVLLFAASMLAASLPLIGVVPEAIVLLLVLTWLGALDVFNDVAMNAQGVMAQHALGRSIMNRLHAMWSLGFVAGAMIGSTMSAAGVGVRPHLLIVGVVLLVAVIATSRWLAPADISVHGAIADGAPPASPARRRSKVVVTMAAAALAAAALEVTPNDWAAVLMRDVFDAGRGSGFGTVVFAGAMLIGRLGGDHVLDRIGERRLVVTALGLAVAGLVITSLAPVTPVALFGLGVWGLGVSVVFPQLYATAARLPGTSSGAGLGSMLLGQRLGAMLTAVAVGALAEWRDVQFAFAAVGVVAVVIIAVSLRTMYRLAPETASPG
jgi:predicted MFS family arabinose efflux permease